MASLTPPGPAIPRPIQSSPWHPASWRTFPARQQPPYAKPADLAPVLARLAALPPLVFPGEIDRLRGRLASAAAGRAFVLQGGDCAERFQDCTEAAIGNKFRILLQMAVVLTYGLRRPVVKLGRLAGQYGKPRSKPVEDGPHGPMASYFGDNVNGFDPEAREPDPARLVEGYFHSAATLNYLRALGSGGFADLHHPGSWDLGALAPSPRSAEYHQVLDRIAEAIGFMESFGGIQGESVSAVDFHTSHEGLHLPFEEAMVRTWEGRHYATSAHFLWIGERTRDLDGAHVEFFRGLANPLGVKLGPGASPQDAVELARALNPGREAGRLAFITRMGAEGTTASLPALVEAVQRAGVPVLWICDPMHGNTQTTPQGRKTRSFDRILTELDQTAAIHRDAGTTLGGVHFELTGEDVTECLGGPSDLQDSDLGLRYETWCDPRLNYGQSMEMAFRLVDILGQSLPPQSKR